MSKKHPSGHLVDLLAILLLLALFATAAYTVVLMGANVYQKTVSNMSENFTTRTALSYLTRMVRTNDRDGSAGVINENGLSILKLSVSYDGEPYSIYIYSGDGTLNELTQKASLPFDPESGRQIMEIDSFSVKETDGLFQFSVTDKDGKAETVSVAERSAL